MAAKETHYQLSWVGMVAKDLLFREKKAVLFSLISRGLFLKFHNNKMIFLSFENFRGPITANLSLDKGALSGLHQGDHIHISKEGLWFPDSQIFISTENAQTWNPAPISAHLLSHQNRSIIMHELVSEIIQQIPLEGVSIFHPILSGISSGKNFSIDQSSEINHKIANLRKQLTQGDLFPLLQSLQSFLGLGSGLTPSGDDFIMGFLLSLNRWRSMIQTEIDLPVLNQAIIEAAFKETTMISANLIECACSGVADERLIKAVDFFATGQGSKPNVLAGILSWGNTSGTDALVGMITAFNL